MCICTQLNASYETNDLSTKKEGKGTLRDFANTCITIDRSMNSQSYIEYYLQASVLFNILCKYSIPRRKFYYARVYRKRVASEANLTRKTDCICIFTVCILLTIYRIL